jgi:hypothetical protein
MAEKFYYLFMGLLVGYLVIRTRNRPSRNKQQSLVFIIIGVFFIYTGAIVTQQLQLPSWFSLVIIAGVIAVEVMVLRNRWVFKRKCEECGSPLDWNTTLMDDRNTCADCLAAREAEETAEEEASEEE